MHVVKWVILDWWRTRWECLDLLCIRICICFAASLVSVKFCLAQTWRFSNKKSYLVSRNQYFSATEKKLGVTEGSWYRGSQKSRFAKFSLFPLSRAGPDGYPRVLDYSIVKSLLVPYSKNFTTRSSSRVETISYFLSNHSNTQKMEMWNFCDILVISSLTKCYNYNNVHFPCM